MELSQFAIAAFVSEYFLGFYGSQVLVLTILHSLRVALVDLIDNTRIARLLFFPVYISAVPLLFLLCMVYFFI